MKARREQVAWHKISALPPKADIWLEGAYAARGANSIGSTIDGSSFSGLLTRVEIGHIRIRLAGNGRISSRGVTQRAAALDDSTTHDRNILILEALCHETGDAHLSKFRWIDQRVRRGRTSAFARYGQAIG